MRRLLCALISIALLTACSGDPEPVVQATPTPTPEPTPTEEPTPEPLVAPLTGLPLDDPEQLDRPILAAKIDNAPQARPQQSLDLADVVFEELVEGGVTRFIALFHSTDPGTFGPVRSGREVDAHLLPPFSPVVAISGAAPPVWDDFRAAGLRTFEEGQADGAFFREREQRAPHNLFATAENLWAAADDLPRPNGPVWPFDAEAPAGGDPAAEVTVRFPRTWSRWTWDDGAHAWLREMEGAPHLARGDAQISAATVVVMRVDVRTGGRVDVTGAATAEMDVVGEGDALVLRDGRAIPARWRKQSPDDQLEWLTPSGQPLPLAPGRMWVQLLPRDGPVEIVPPEEPAAAGGDDAAGADGDAEAEDADG